MSLDWSRLAGASLAVAVGLVVVAASAWVVLWAQPEDEGRTRAAREHLAPLAEWGLGLLALHGVVLILAADTSLASWALVVLLACAAAVIHQPPPAPDEEPEPTKPPRAAPAAEPAERAPAPAPGSLWAKP